MQRIILALITLALTADAARLRTLPEIQLPYTFEVNQGQTDPAVRYLARGKGYTLYLTEREAVLALKKHGVDAQALRMSLSGGRRPDAIEAIDRDEARSNYFVGRDSREWRLSVPHFSRVRYRGVYEGIDAVYHSSEGQLEYDFVVAPGAAPSRIGLHFEGARKVRVNRAGELELTVEGGVLKHRRPEAYQEIAGKRRTVEARYEMRDGAVGFRLGEYDRSQPLVIDPVVVYSTYLGGNAVDSVNAVAVDKDGNVYVAGETTSLDYPVVGTPLFTPKFALTYGFVTKINAAGDKILYSSYLGGSSSTRNLAIQVDRDGNAYLGGVTGARDFPLANPTQSTQPGLNIGFVAKLNPAGNSLLFSTYIGGERNDRVDALAIDAQGSIYVTGYATSTTLPVLNAFQPKIGGSSDALVAKWSAPDYRLAYASYLGGTGEEDPYGITVDSLGAAYVTGFTYSPNLATANVYQSKMLSSGDTYVARVAPDGSLGFFTYLGGDNADRPQAIALDHAGNLVITGSTSSKNFPVTDNAVQKELKGYVDAFVTKMDPAGKTILYSTYLGGTQATGAQFLEEGRGVAVDPQGNLVVAGVTNSADFPSVRPVQAYSGNTDAFVTVLSADGSSILYSTAIGGSKEELTHGMAVDATGAVYVAGQTQSPDFSLKNAIRNTFGGTQEGFLSKICDPAIILSNTTLAFVKLPGSVQPANQNVFVNACAAIPFSVTSTGAFLKVTPSEGTTNATLTASVDASGLEPGDYKGSITVTAADATNSPQTIDVTLTVAPPPPAITAAGIVNGASGKSGAVAPGELVVIYGANLGPDQLAGLAVNGDSLTTQIADTRVLFDDVPAPMIYAAAGQVSAVVPYAMEGRASIKVEVERYGVRSNVATMSVTAASPALFTVNASGSGQGAIINQDGSVNGDNHAAAAGEVVVLYATGEGQTDPGGVDGKLALQTLPKPVQPVTATIGGQTAEVMYGGAAPGMVAGLMQINVKVPAGLTPGTVPVQVSVGAASSPDTVTLVVR